HLNFHSFPTRRSSDLNGSGDEFRALRRWVGSRLVPIVFLTIAILTLAPSGSAIAGSWARSNDLARKFPDFPKQKRQLTTIAVVRSQEHTSELQSRSDL